MSNKHWRVSPEGQRMGQSAVRLAQRGQRRLEALGLTNLQLPTLRDEMCKSCACRPNTVPNGCLHTQLDLLKTAAEGKPFLCHAPKDGRMCAGWAAMRAELVANPLPEKVMLMLAKHELLPSDEPAIV